MPSYCFIENGSDSFTFIRPFWNIIIISAQPSHKSFIHVLLYVCFPDTLIVAAFSCLFWQSNWVVCMVDIKRKISIPTSILICCNYIVPLLLLLLIFVKTVSEWDCWFIDCRLFWSIEYNLLGCLPIRVRTGIESNVGCPKTILNIIKINGSIDFLLFANAVAIWYSFLSGFRSCSIVSWVQINVINIFSVVIRIVGDLQSANVCS